MPDKLDLLEYWYRAAHSQVGICVPTNNAKLLKEKLYNVRRNAQDPLLDELMLASSPAAPESEVWIIHKKVSLNGEES